MSACTADRDTIYREGLELEYPVKAATKIYAGSMVAVDSTGYAIPAANAAGHQLVGVALEQVDNSLGASGARQVRVRTAGVFDFTATSISQANVGAEMYVVDDQTFDEVNPGQGIRCGKLVKYVSATRGWIKI
ncbi:DUF2190 family protein [Desulfobacca acetoxidans]|uniref:Putative cytoplasmic protein n=1 Tax=Desulfobacca acetoxidans (strain ATCC 700848 / DSM 11109 / ASRB2) TaxID=880072 RepID=F2NCR0_DESAR|nr:DUF2190 family protein [Desulfobacca acetoxidans]AEB09341.1 putative cytoplasmic protein [Desulfobacca acetoxidans DSM 11109]